MKRSIVLVILNKIPNRMNVVKIIKKALYTMNMSLAILIDKRTEEIKEQVTELTNTDASKILDIICIIHSPQSTHRTFNTEDGILDLYHDIIHPFMAVEGFQNKTKVIITSGIEHDISLNVTDDSNGRMYSNGRNTAIVSSMNTTFISTFIPKLVSLRNLRTTIAECSNLVSYHAITETNIELRIPLPSEANTPSEYYEVEVR